MRVLEILTMLGLIFCTAGLVIYLSIKENGKEDRKDED